MSEVPDPAFLRLVEIKVNETIVTPEQYGAVGDGVTDDTYAINSAFAAIASGGTVFFTQGNTYLYSGFYKFNEQSNFAIDGNNSTFLFSSSYDPTGNTNADKAGIQISGCVNFVVKNFQFRRELNCSQRKFILINSAKNALIADLDSEVQQENKELGFSPIDFYSNNYNVLVERCTFKMLQGRSVGGIFVRNIWGGTTKLWFSECEFVSNQNDENFAVDAKGTYTEGVSASTTIYAYNCRFKKTAGYGGEDHGVQIVTCGHNTHDSYANNLRVVLCSCEVVAEDNVSNVLISRVHGTFKFINSKLIFKSASTNCTYMARGIEFEESEIENTEAEASLNNVFSLSTLSNCYVRNKFPQLLYNSTAINCKIETTEASGLLTNAELSSSVIVYKGDNDITQFSKAFSANSRIVLQNTYLYCNGQSVKFSNSADTTPVVIKNCKFFNIKNLNVAGAKADATNVLQDVELIGTTASYTENQNVTPVRCFINALPI